MYIPKNDSLYFNYVNNRDESYNKDSNIQNNNSNIKDNNIKNNTNKNNSNNYNGINNGKNIYENNNYQENNIINDKDIENNIVSSDINSNGNSSSVNNNLSSNLSSSINNNSNTNSSYSKDYTTENNNIKNRITSKYNINVILYNEYSQNQIYNYIELPLIDGYKTNKMLTTLENELSKYPSNFFNDFYTNNSRYSIIFGFADSLKNYIYEGEAALDTNSPNYIGLYFRYDSSFKKKFHFYMMYVIEYFMRQKNGETLGYNNWNAFNPTSFLYGNIDERYSYEKNNKGSYFLYNLSQINETMDRASVFSALMTDTRTQVYFKHGHKIYDKALAIVNNLAKTFNSCHNRTNLNHWNNKIK